MLPFLLFLCALTGVASSEVTSPPPSPPPSSSMTLETWELALIIGCGTLALLMCAYSVFILMRRRNTAKPVTKVIVNMEEGRIKKTESKTVEKKESKTVAKKESKSDAKKGSKTDAKKKSKTVEMKESKTVEKKESKVVDKKDAKASSKKEMDKKDVKAAVVKSGDASADVIAVKIQPNNYAVTCPGGGKPCIGARKDGVQTIPQPNKLPAPKIRRDSAPSRMVSSSARSNVPRI